MQPKAKMLSFSKPINWALWIITTFMLFTFHQCKCRTEKDKAPAVVIKSRIKAPHGIAFIDVNDAIPTNVSKVKVTLIDPGKMVVSSNGIAFQTVELTGGVMSVGLLPRAEFSVQNPYRFSIRAEAEGYMTNIRSFVITDSMPNYVSVYLAKIVGSGLPSGLAASAGNINTVSGGVFTQDQVLRAALDNRNIDPLTIRIPKGTQLLYGDRPIKDTGAVSFRLLFGKPRDRNANLAFPGGFEVTDAIDENGKRIAGPANPLFFATAGWFSMEMNIGKAGVDGFSNPITVEIPIADTVINPATQQVVKAGDKIPFWSLNHSTATWRLESNTEIIAAGDGRLKVNLSIRHLSSFNLDYWDETTCNISVPFNTVDFSGLRYSEFIDQANVPLRGKVVNFSEIPAGRTSPSPLEILRVPTRIISAANPGKLFVHRSTDPYSPLIGGSRDLTCTGSSSLDKLSSAAFPSVAIRFERGGSGTLVVNNTLWHKPEASAPRWINVGNLEAPVLAIPHDATIITQQLQLWYTNNAGNAVTLTFNMNFTASGTGASGEKIEGGATSAFVFDYSVVSPGPGTSVSLITVTIPSTII